MMTTPTASSSFPGGAAAAAAASNGSSSSLKSNSSSNDNTLVQAGFKITTRKLPILKAGPIDRMTEQLGIAPPEMIFGDNFLRIEHMSSNWQIEFNAFDALDCVDKTGENMLKVAYSKEWQRHRQRHYEDIKEVVKPFDWSYSTGYRGSTSRETTTATISPNLHFKPSTEPIPLHLLKRPDPILFFDDVMLYEDELADNGISMMSCKIRVMPGRLLLLSRFFMRLDNVIFRIRDTRVYIEFSTAKVIREYVAREEKYEPTRDRLTSLRQDVPAMMRDANSLSEILPVVDRSCEEVVLK